MCQLYVCLYIYNAAFIQRYMHIKKKSQETYANSIDPHLFRKKKAIPMVSRAPFLLALLLAAALLSSCHASRDAPAGEEEKAMVVPMADPKCEVMERCSVQSCTDYCISIGLGWGIGVGFCTFHGMQFYCCCPIPDPPSRA